MRVGRPSRRLFAAGLALTMAGALSTACATGANSGGGGGNGPISIITDNSAWKPGFQQVGNAMQKITGHNLNVESVPVQTNYQQMLDQSLAAKPADIVKSGNGLQLQQLAATNELTDLTSVWNDAVEKGWLDDSLRPYYTYKGKVYAVPMTRSYWVVFYNKKLFQQLGIRVPTTYQQFTAAAATLKAHNVTPIWSGGVEGWTSFIPYQTLVGAVSPDFYNNLAAGTAAFSDPASQQAMTLWQTWLDKGWTTPYDAKMADAPALLKAGKLGMFPVGTWETQSLDAAGLVPGTDYGAFLMPEVDSGTPQTVFFEGNGLAVPTRAPDHAAAMQQIEAWLNPSVQTVWSKFLGDASPNPTVPISNPVINGISADVKSTNAKQLIRYFEALPPTLVQDSTTIWGNFMLHPNDLAQSIQALDQAQTKDVAAWKQQNP